MILPVARKGYHGLAIELKRKVGGKLSTEQAQWLDALNAQGWYAVVCKGATESIRLLQAYLQPNGEIEPYLADNKGKRL